MTLREACTATDRVGLVIAEAMNEVEFGPDRGRQEAGVLIAIAGMHVANMRTLLKPEWKGGFISAYALARATAECCMRALYLNCCQTDIAYTGVVEDFLAGKQSRRVNGKENPFRSMHQLIICVREVLSASPDISKLDLSGGPAALANLDALSHDWAALNDLTHGGRGCTRLFVEGLKRKAIPDVESAIVLARTNHMFVHAVILLLAWQAEPVRANRVQNAFRQNFPYDF